jgi:hypothetical protein
VEWNAPKASIWHYLRQRFYTLKDNVYILRTGRLLDAPDHEFEIYDDEEEQVTSETGVTGTTKSFGRHQTSRFIREVAAAVKAKFGTPKRNEANRMAIRDYAVRVMKEVGHRTTHIIRDVPLVERLAFQPTMEELEQARLESHPMSELAREQYAYRTSSSSV